MTIQIKDDIKTARLEGNAKLLDILVVLKSDIELGLSQKQPVKAQKTIQRVLGSYTETLALVSDLNARTDLLYKIHVVSSYAIEEKLLDTAQLQVILLQSQPVSIGAWMGYLKTNYPDQYNGKTAKEVFDGTLK